jgi:hypothetical protein
MTAPATVSARRRKEIIDSLRRGTVPTHGLDVLAVGLDRFTTATDAELTTVTGGGAVFKALRGDYGAGKTFYARWLADRARRAGMATAEVQVSETETPLHRLETVYRRITESLSTAEFAPSALRPVLDQWLYGIESEVLGAASDPSDTDAVNAGVDRMVEQRLAAVARSAPTFATALRGYRAATVAEDTPTADALAAWLGGQPNVSARARAAAGVRGDLDHFGAFGFLQGLLTMLRDCGHPGLLVVLDEVETLQRMRSDSRDKALNALRQVIDDLDSGRFPGLYLLITGTPAFFEGPQGVARLAPLAQRLATDFTTDARFDNPRAVQIRLAGFTRDRLIELGTRVRALYAIDAVAADRIDALADDTYLATLADAVAGRFGERVGVAPRVFLKKLVADVLDRIDQFPDFNPRQHYRLTIAPTELTDVERQAYTVQQHTADDVTLDV